jgi:cellulose synthase/poly-beta-1,6-N-acetylglucosamine synthase-like glycosyltransferase
MSEPALSVVIIGRNEGRRLERCLHSVWAMSHPFGALDVIYVDSCSSDGSAARAAALGAKVVELKSGRMCAARARNSGWQIAQAPFILFLDGDTVLDPGFPAKALAEFENPQMMVVYGDRREINTEASVYNRIMDLDWIVSPGLKDSCGGDAVFRRSALEKAGGFNPELIAGEEPELCRRIRAAGGLILRIDALMTGHDLAILIWRQYWRRAVRTGHAFAEVSSLFKNTEYPMWLAESKRNILNGSLYCGGLIAALTASAITHNWLYVAAFFAIVAMRVFRTAIKFRWKSASPWDLILFGVHSHIQQIPILVGQIKYWMHAKRNSRAELIEYKTP